MKFFWNKFSSPESGFTLFEMLIAMCLTAVIGAVMFQTWNMVAQSGVDAARILRSREKERIAFALMDNDMANMIFPGEENPDLPAPAVSAIELSDEFYSLTRREKKADKKNDNSRTLLSFASSGGLSQEKALVGLPSCIEYNLLAAGTGLYTLARRERQYCGIDGDFPWQESLILENLRDAQFEIILPNGRRLTQWKASDLSPQPVALRLVWTTGDNQEREILFPIPAARIEVDWEEK